MFDRVFCQDDLSAFAHLSGDFNPIHADPTRARRLLFHSTVAHGISVLLWALDCGIRSRRESLRLVSLRAKFKKPVHVGERVVCRVKEEHDRGASIEVANEDGAAAEISVDWATTQLEEPAGFAPSDPERASCLSRSIADLAEARGRVALHLNAKRLGALYPALAERMEPVQISQLLATTRVVGMECPGLSSIYTSLDLDFGERRTEGEFLEYEACEVDDRIGRVKIAVRSKSLDGTLVTFVRPLPPEQADAETLSKRLRAGEFESQRALIVGGSRGIGEVAAKLLAGGGAAACLTFHQGREEADAIVADITRHGGKASSLSLNVLEPPPTSFQQWVSEHRPTHLYYFATPGITAGTHRSFSSAAFSRFCDFYVTGFASVVAEVSTSELAGIFFPSSVFVEELPPNMAEYSAAKSAGEALCGLMEKWYPGVSIARPRLPRTRTDQTVSLVRERLPRPEEIILGHLRTLHEATRGKPA